MAMKLSGWAWVKTLGLFALSAILTTGAFEIFFRASEVSLPPAAQNDVRLGRALKPHARIFLAEEGLYIGSVNRFGYLGSAYPQSRATSTFRIAVVGDSYVEAFQVLNEHNFLSVLMVELTDLLGIPVEVLNFGRSGLDLRTMYIVDQLQIRDFQPDLVLYVVFADDFRQQDTSRGPRCLLVDQKPEIDFSFVDSEAFKHSQERQPIKHFAVFSLLQKAASRHSNGQTAETILDKLYRGSRAVHEPRPKEMTAEPFLALNTAILAKLGQLQSHGHAKTAFITVPGVPQIYREAILANGLLTFDLAETLSSLRSSGVNPNYWAASRQEGHWNHPAHQAIGNALAHEISRWVDSSRTEPWIGDNMSR